MAKRKPKDSTALNDSIFHQVEVEELKSRLADLNERHKHTLAMFKESNAQLRAILGLKEEIEGHPPKHMKVLPSGETGESTAVLVASDWHLEERVDPKTVDGVNEFNPIIAEARVTKLFQRGLSMVEMTRHRTRIDTMVLAVLGDLISGYIHEDLAESNYLSPTEASLKAYRLVCGGIDFLLKEGKFKKLLVPCTIGNHSRTTKRPRIQTAAKNSFEWMLYHLLADKYSKEPRVEFSITDGYFNFVNVYATRLRFHHGDNVRYQGGVGGVEIPLNKALAQWNKYRPVDIDILGHWHTRKTATNFVVNGSLIGFNAFAVATKCSYEPPSQSFFLIHPKWGKTIEIPILFD